MIDNKTVTLHTDIAHGEHGLLVPTNVRKEVSEPPYKDPLETFHTAAQSVEMNRDQGGLFNDSEGVIWSSTTGEPAPTGYNIAPPSLPMGYTYLRSVINTAFPTVTHIVKSLSDKQVFYIVDKHGVLIAIQD